MQTKLLNEIVEEIAGKLASSVLELLIGKKDVNEFLIAKKLKLTINQVRNIFYKLANFGLVSFTRKKDKRKGWYTYFWTLNIERALELLDKRLDKEIRNLKYQLESRKRKRFYICKACNTEVTEENALLHDFTCQECGEVYELSETEQKIGELRKKIIRLERQKKEVSSELDKIKEAKKKKIAREEKKLKREKARKRKRKAKKKLKKPVKKAKKKPKKKKVKKKKSKKPVKKAKKKPKKKKR